MQEYPKALYLAGAMAMAANEEQEADLREAGHLDWHADQQRTKHGDAGTDAAPEPVKADTSVLDEAKAQLEELEVHLMAKADHLAAQEQALAMREKQLEQAEADLAARLAPVTADAGKSDGAQTPAVEEKAAARSRNKPSATQ